MANQRETTTEPPSLGNFGDDRLEKVGRDLLAALVEERTVTVRRLSGSRRAQEIRFFRFLHNENVTIEEMLDTTGEETGRRCKGRDVLVLQDTTEINYEHHRQSKRGFGTVGNGKDIGIFLHPLLAVEASSGGILGLADCITMNRRRRPTTPACQRPLEKKESRRWLEGARRAGRVLEGAASITMVADRESDIYEEFARRPTHVDLLTRAAQNRLLANGEYLYDFMEKQPEAERYFIDVPAKGRRRPREAMVSLHYGEVELRRPVKGSKSCAPTVRLRAVFAQEIAPPRGQPAVEWMLLTTHEVATVEDAKRIVAWYRLRWIIEELNRTLKGQGMKVEESQITKASVAKKMCIAALIAAASVIQLVRARDGKTGQKLTDGFDEEDKPLLEKLNKKFEGKTEKQQNPHRKGTLAWAAWIIGRMGGWTGYYKPPGPKVMHIGLVKFQAAKQGWWLAQET